MPGIYLHIPFCKQACHYCDFHFSTSLKNKEALIEALKQEITLRKDYLRTPHSALRTVYFGGGTPSLLTHKELMSIFETLHLHFEIAKDAEITLEANPDDLTKEKIKELRESPVNRLSIGIQSFRDQDLKFMNRAHSAKEAVASVKRSQDAGITNISIDLIYGTPGMDNAAWKNNLTEAFALEVPHLSAYCLTVEKGTALHHFVKTGKSPGVEEQQGADQLEILMDTAEKAGFIQYEISNFCKEGMHSRHNSSYWEGTNYLGIGPSAHSFDGASRQWNVADNNKYIAGIEKGKPDLKREVLTKEQQYNEYILTSLRRKEGTDLNYICERFGEEFRTYCKEEARPYSERGMLKVQNNNLALSRAGKLIADKIASDLFIVS